MSSTYDQWTNNDFLSFTCRFLFISDLWMKYIELEMHSCGGKPELVGSLHWKATKNLQPNLLDEFNERYTMLVTSQQSGWKRLRVQFDDAVRDLWNGFMHVPYYSVIGTVMLASCPVDRRVDFVNEETMTMLQKKSWVFVIVQWKKIHQFA